MSYIDPADLPDELMQEDGETHAAPSREELLSELGVTVGKHRDEAVLARTASGIEGPWMACEEAYLCIDDLNRSEYAGTSWVKPMTTTGPVQSSSGKAQDGRSTAFVRLTARYVDMAAAKLAEIVLPIDDKPFSFKPTPVPDPVPQPVQLPAQLPPPPQQMGMLPQQPPTDPMAVQPAGAMPGIPPGAEAQKDPLAVAAEAAENRIYDWMVEAKYPAHMRRVLRDSARIGVGILKGPFPEMKKGRAILKNPTTGKVTFRVEQKVIPSFKAVSPWNFFPHKACGEDIHKGDYVFERDYVSEATLKAMKEAKTAAGDQIYMATQIDKVIDQGPDGHKSDSGRNPRKPATGKADKDRFEIWYFTGIVQRNSMQAADAILDDLPKELQDIPAIVTIINNTVIRSQLNPSQSGRYPYSVKPWSPREDHWAGIGVGEQVGMAQKVVNAGTRGVFNNAGISAGVQVIIDRLGVEPADGVWTLTPNKIWYKTGESTVDDVRKIFMSVEFPNLTAQLMPIIELGMKMAEEACNIPLISQGQNGPQDVQTFGQAELQNNNANTLLRDQAYSLDDCITEPVVDACYEWLLLDENVPNEEKGDWQINARGSSSMVEKAIQEQTLIQMAQMVVNPAFGMDPKRWSKEMLKSKRMDPRKIMFSEEELAKQAQQPQPEAPAIAAAKINAASREKAALIGADVTKARVAADTDRDTVYVNAETERTRLESEYRAKELDAKIYLAELTYANTNKVTLDQIKGRLTETAMKLDVQKDLSLASHMADLHKHKTGSIPQVIAPPTEPVGRAPVGESFQA